MSAAGSFETTSPDAVKPTIVSRWPFVPLKRKPSSLPEPNESDATSGMPALTYCSASASERSCVTTPSSPNVCAYATLNGQLPAPL